MEREDGKAPEQMEQAVSSREREHDGLNLRLQVETMQSKIETMQIELIACAQRTDLETQQQTRETFTPSASIHY